ncbi:hypothetical protein LTS18_012539 [Coniosporium uncinatum]|uniref:Uncharacterized protein n=1 Tax=Coniosporium uncinatum TaxID=93489 RepID=A0ACC3D9L7_9PEZI|nr:hypothetical protein LTS18_012539 [Coniosporium uncinatum]
MPVSKKRLILRRSRDTAPEPSVSVSLISGLPTYSGASNLGNRSTNFTAIRSNRADRNRRGYPIRRGCTGIPFELRQSVNQEYLSALNDTGKVTLAACVGSTYIFPPILRNAIFQINTHMRREATMALIEINIFSMQTGAQSNRFRGWLESLQVANTDGFESVRSLQFPLFDCFDRSKYGDMNPDMKLMVDCPGLTHVRFKLDNLRRTLYANMCSHLTPAITDTAKTVIDYYSMHELLKLEKLKDLVIEVDSITYHASNTINGPSTVASDIKKWLGAEFDKRRMHTTISLVL